MFLFVFPDKTNSRGFQRVLWKSQLKQAADPQPLPEQKMVHISKKVLSLTSCNYSSQYMNKYILYKWLTLCWLMIWRLVFDYWEPLSIYCYLYYTCETQKLLILYLPPVKRKTCFITPVHKHVYFFFLQHVNMQVRNA